MTIDQCSVKKVFKNIAKAKQLNKQVLCDEGALNSNYSYYYNYYRQKQNTLVFVLEIVIQIPIIYVLDYCICIQCIDLIYKHSNGYFCL